MNELSLFTGGGGGVLGTMLLGFRHIGYVEWDDYCQRIIRQRIDDGILHEAPIFGDIRAFISDGYAASYTGMVDVLTAGFPCQPFSVAGKRKGAEDERNMWPATRDVIRIVKPRFVLLENVPGIRRYLPVVIRDLRRLGYAVRRPLVLGADDVGAPHRRKRVWILAYTERNGRAFAPLGGCVEEAIREEPEWPQHSQHPAGASCVSRTEGDVADAECDGRRPRRAEREGQQGWAAFIGASDVAYSECLWKLQPERGKCDERGRAGNGCETLADTESGESDRRERRDMAETAIGREGEYTALDACGEDVAHPESISGGARLRQSGPERDGGISCDSGGDAADALRSGCEEQHPPDPAARSGQHTGLSLVERGAARRPTQPRLGGMVDGISNRMDLPCPFAEGSG